MISIFFIIILVNLFIYINLNKISKIINLNDYPNKKLKAHGKITPLLGGSIFIFNILFLYIYNQFFQSNFFDIFLNNSDKLLFLAILLIIFILGFCDDKYNLSPNIKLLLLIVISAIFIFLDKNILIQNLSLSFFENKIFLKNYSIIFSIFCFVMLINALNFYDGINCQSIIFFIITFAYLLIISKRYEFYYLILIILIFLFYLNFKNKIFLGDNGIYVLSITLSMALIYEHNVHKNIIFADEIFLLLILPGLDLVRLSFFRLLRKQNPFKGDRNHIHHLLIKKYSLIKTNLVLFFLGVAPIILFKVLKLNFFIVFTITIFIYSFIIVKSKK
jgi:UDP-GlcNAc:undecaprenyl-phosphate GlcNAc-1-phosphate transferase